MSIVRDFERAFNRQDVGGLVACFTPRTAAIATRSSATTPGTASLRAMFERMFREGRDYAWSMEKVVEAPAMAAAEWTFSYVVTDAVPRSAGRKVRFHGMSLFELDGGKIRAYREYFDEGVALLQLGFSARGAGQGAGPPRRLGTAGGEEMTQRARVTHRAQPGQLSAAQCGSLSTENVAVVHGARPSTHPQLDELVLPAGLEHCGRPV